MRIQSRLGKLERSAGRGVDDIRRPAEVPEEIWRCAMELLTALPPQELGPWQSVDGVAQGSSETGPQGPADFPRPLLDCLIRAAHEAQKGALPPPWNERGRLLRANLEKWSDDKLIDFLRAGRGESHRSLPAAPLFRIAPGARRVPAGAVLGGVLRLPTAARRDDPGRARGRVGKVSAALHPRRSGGNRQKSPPGDPGILGRTAPCVKSLFCLDLASRFMPKCGMVHFRLFLGNKDRS